MNNFNENLFKTKLLPFLTFAFERKIFLCKVKVFFLSKEHGLESSPSGAAFESKIKASAKKLFSNLGIDDEVNMIVLMVFSSNPCKIHLHYFWYCKQMIIL